MQGFGRSGPISGTIDGVNLISESLTERLLETVAREGGGTAEALLRDAITSTGVPR